MWSVTSNRGVKIGMQIVVSQRPKVVVHRIAVHFWRANLNWHSNVIVSFNTH